MSSELEIFILLERYFDLKKVIKNNSCINDSLINEKLNNIDNSISELKLSLKSIGIRSDEDFKSWYSYWNQYLGNLSIDEYRNYITFRLNHNLDSYTSSLN